MRTNPDRISIEVTNRCAKGCGFCHNQSQPKGQMRWEPAELVAFVRDCAAHGVKAVSFGGGEPLQYRPIFQVIKHLRGVIFRSLTTNGLRLDTDALDRLAVASPDKVHISIHFPRSETEVRRVIRQVGELTDRGLRAGVNLLVARTDLKAAARAGSLLRASGIGNDRIVYLPMRGRDTPTPAELAAVAGGLPFESMSCLLACEPSDRFVSIGSDQTVALCSYTAARHPLPELTYRGLLAALEGLDLTFCGGTEPP